MIRPGRRPAAAPRRPRAVLLIGAVAGAVALAGCAAGQVAQTAYQANNGGGADVNVGGLLVRGAQITFPAEAEGGAVYRAGGNAPVQLRLINQGTVDDRILSASSPVAASVQITGPTDLPTGVSMVVGAENQLGGQTTPGATEPPAKPRIDSGVQGPNPNTTIAPSSAPVEAPDVSPTGSQTAGGEAPAVGLRTPPPIAVVDPSTRYSQMTLTGLREDVRPGLSYELVLNFERAGAVRVMLPVGYPGSPREPEKAG